MAEIFHDSAILVGEIIISVPVFAVIVSLLPHGNPLKKLLNALCARVAVTLGAGAIALPIEWVPGVDILYDIGAPIALIYFWYTFFRDAVRPMQLPTSSAKNACIIENNPR